MNSGGRVVYGASWRRHGERRLRAARIARMLWPAVRTVGGVVSTELTVPFRGRWFRPDVGALLSGDHPTDGVLTRAPSLVVRLGDPLSAEAWLQAGAGAVWAVEADTIWELTPRRRRVLTPDEWLTHPGEVTLRLPARELRGSRSHETRAGASAEPRP
jgi:hypothetical protein